MLELWNAETLQFPKNLKFEYKSETDLYEFAKNKTLPTSIDFSPDGQLMVMMSKDLKIRIFNVLSGKLFKIFDESLSTFTELQAKSPQMDNIEFGRRLAVDREIIKNDALKYTNAVFDESGNFILYATMLGIKVVNIRTNKCSKVIGKSESSARFLNLALYQGRPNEHKIQLSIDVRTSENPTITKNLAEDPTLFCTAYGKERFYLFTRRSHEDGSSELHRDVFNELPSREERLAATEAIQEKLPSSIVLHTTLGDIFINLFVEECPKTVENFAGLCKKGYYDSLIFHRVEQGFMIQTGDPEGDGTGGESLWGGTFEDEFHRNLRHDRPFTVSMANAGPDTNASQFFITVAPTPWLDNKHTVFGRVSKGMDVVQTISMTKVHPKSKKPYEDIKIINCSILQ
ncbi:peptidylprolyl isomerase domain and WD repeat-containing protein 1-like [Zophobas morio]|uniref:peptidylprolyl isomerase domain and WD repeat-containing protein 1-like n=1 Tax=Zophobas morio TaxID=2755281 RepID=UPI003082FD10